MVNKHGPDRQNDKAPDVLQHIQGGVNGNLGGVSPVFASDLTDGTNDAIFEGSACSEVDENTIRDWMEALQVQSEQVGPFSYLDETLAPYGETGARFTGALVADTLRRTIRDDNGRDFRVDNNHLGVYVREAVRRNPKLRKCVRLRGECRFNPLYPDLFGGGDHGRAN